MISVTHRRGVPGTIVSKYKNAGQTCVCANRILPQGGVYDAFTRLLTETGGAMQVADGFEPGYLCLGGI
jgi:succinate-semialdehyde dehydrogenase/glutarate-semialdehyde dehydrogenase